MYSPHTACDAVWGGVNDWLAEGVTAGGKLDEIDILGQRTIDSLGEEEGGQGRVVKFKEPIDMSKLETRIKKHLKLSQSEPIYPLLIALINLTLLVVQVGYPAAPPKLIKSVAICAGSGGSILLGYDADVYFTGEMSHARRLTIGLFMLSRCLISCSHYSTKCSQQLQPVNTSSSVRFRYPCARLFAALTFPSHAGGHTNTERGYLPILATKLRAELKQFQNTEAFASFGNADQDIVRQLEVHVSVEDQHPLRFV